MFGVDFETRVLAKTYAAMTAIFVLCAAFSAGAGAWVAAGGSLAVAAVSAYGWWYWVASV